MNQDERGIYSVYEGILILFYQYIEQFPGMFIFDYNDSNSKRPHRSGYFAGVHRDLYGDLAAIYTTPVFLNNTFLFGPDGEFNVSSEDWLDWCLENGYCQKHSWFPLCQGMYKRDWRVFPIKVAEDSGGEPLKQVDQVDGMVSFGFDNHPVRVSVDESGSVWWVAADVCEALDIKQATRALDRLNGDEKGVTTIHTLGGPQEMLTINEPGLYRLIFTSRKKEAENFKRWVFHEVLPTIRKTGAFSMTRTLRPTSLADGPPTPEGLFDRFAVTYEDAWREHRRKEALKKLE